MQSAKRNDYDPEGRRILTCTDLEKIEVNLVVKDSEPETDLTYFEIFPVEEARANKAKACKIRENLATINSMIKDASLLGESYIKIPDNIDVIANEEISKRFRNAGYTVIEGFIRW